MNFIKGNLVDLMAFSSCLDNEWDEPNYWLSALTLNGKLDQLMLWMLLKKRILSHGQFGSLCICNLFLKNMILLETDVSEKLFENGVCLPCDTKMTDGDLKELWRLLRSCGDYK